MTGGSIWRWVWMLGYLTTAIYVFIFVVDCGIHFHEGYTRGTRQHERAMIARRDCETGHFQSDVLLARCVEIRDLPVPVPWHVAIHFTGKHLAAKLTSALNSMLLLAALAVCVFICTLKLQMAPPLPLPWTDQAPAGTKTQRPRPHSRPTAIQLPEIGGRSRGIHPRRRRRQTPHPEAIPPAFQPQQQQQRQQGQAY